MFNKSADCENKIHGHWFPFPGSDCVNCGVNQYELSGMKLQGFKEIFEEVKPEHPTYKKIKSGDNFL